MGHFSMKISALTESILSGTQQCKAVYSVLVPINTP